MRVYTYVIDHDLGFAPNPFHGACTLAACKPKIRQFAQVGDFVIGTGSTPNNRAGLLVYWMEVNEILTFDQYWADPRFVWKRPLMRGSLMLRYGDNIYHRDLTTCAFLQEDSFHSEPHGVLSASNLQRDTGTTDRVLISWEFAYWGGDGPPILPEFSEFVHETQGHKCRFPPERAVAFASWLKSLPDRGLVSDPTDWPG